MEHLVRQTACKTGILLAFLLVLIHNPVQAQGLNELKIKGTRFYLNNQPFQYNGISFFNAIYNPAFNKSEAERNQWIRKFNQYGVKVLRIWGQWDNSLGFVDACKSCSLYNADGTVKPAYLATLKNIIAAADQQQMVVELALFSRESWNENIRLSPEASKKAAAILARELKLYRNVTFQIWNENSVYVKEVFESIKAVDAQRLVTNSPGYGGDMGNDKENELLDFLTPHTSRYGKHWEIAKHELAKLLLKFNKPVVDDEPARTGTANFGGPAGRNLPADFMLHIYNMWQIGSYAIYHHDMFQTGYGSEAIPPSGIPDPEFSPFHKPVFEFLSQADRFVTE